MLLATTHVSTDAEADARAKAAALHLGHERVQGSAVAQGDPLLLAGEYVKISGVGTRFGGTHRIVSAVHIYGSRGYFTQLTLGAGGRPLAESMQGGRGRGFADHLVIGIVTDNKDPDKLGRVKVKYPLLNDEVESGWARIAWGAAGKERGTVAIPHVSDELAIGFEHGDVRRPVILGALFNGVDTPGRRPRQGHELGRRPLPARPRRRDEEEDPARPAPRTSRSRARRGPFALDASKDIKLTAARAGTITIEASAGQIKATGKAGVEISASGPLKITSTAPVTVESNAALQLKGSVVQVQASGVLQLSGATVMIG